MTSSNRLPNHSPNWGGARPNSGPIQRNIRLSRETAQQLRLLCQYFALTSPPDIDFSPSAMVDALICQAVERMHAYVENEESPIR